MLDFHHSQTKEWLFSLNEEQFFYLNDIFQSMQYRTGMMIDQYNDGKLSIENQQALVTIIDDYVAKADLNQNKEKTKQVLAFRTFMIYFVEHNVNLILLAD